MYHSEDMICLFNKSSQKNRRTEHVKCNLYHISVLEFTLRSKPPVWEHISRANKQLQKYEFFKCKFLI